MCMTQAQGTAWWSEVPGWGQVQIHVQLYGWGQVQMGPVPSHACLVLRVWPHAGTVLRASPELPNHHAHLDRLFTFPCLLKMGALVIKSRLQRLRRRKTWFSVTGGAPRVALSGQVRGARARGNKGPRGLGGHTGKMACQGGWPPDCSRRVGRCSCSVPGKGWSGGAYPAPCVSATMRILTLTPIFPASPHHSQPNPSPAPEPISVYLVWWLASLHT